MISERTKALQYAISLMDEKIAELNDELSALRGDRDSLRAATGESMTVIRKGGMVQLRADGEYYTVTTVAHGEDGTPSFFLRSERDKEQMDIPRVGLKEVRPVSTLFGSPVEFDLDLPAVPIEPVTFGSFSDYK